MRYTEYLPHVYNGYPNTGYPLPTFIAMDQCYPFQLPPIHTDMAKKSMDTAILHTYLLSYFNSFSLESEFRATTIKRPSK